MENTLITIEEIDKLASLSALDFSEEEKEKLIGEVSGIVAMLNECREVDTNGVIDTQVLGLDELREDVVDITIDNSELLSSAPVCSNGYVVVPRVVE